MADQSATPEQGEPQEPATEQEQETTEQATDALPESIKAILAKERAAAREAEKRAKAAEKRAKEFEDRDKTEAEKLAERAQQAEQKATDLEARYLRLQVALDKKVPADLTDFLTGSTREEIEGKADALLAHLKPATATDFDSGAREPVDEQLPPEQQHNQFLAGLLGGQKTT